MDESSNARGLTRRWFPLALAVLACLPCPPAGAQTELSLAELGAREAKPDYAPIHLGQRATVRGVVSARAFHFPEYTLLAIQEGGRGGIIEAERGDDRLDGFAPGDEVLAEGVVDNIAGTPALVPDRINTLAKRAAPMPVEVPVEALVDFPGNLVYLGRLVRVVGQIGEVSDTTAGAQVFLGPPGHEIKLFLPSVTVSPAPSFLQPGWTASATGVAVQYCPIPPFDRFFEVLEGGPGDIRVMAVNTVKPLLSLSPLSLAAGIAVVLLVALFLWNRDHRLRKQRERLRKIYQLGEEILSAPSAAAILRRTSEILPGILGVTRVHLFIYNRATKTLDGASDDGGTAVSIPLASPPAGTQSGVVACFSYRTLLAIPDIDRSPFPIAKEAGAESPRSLLFVPMLAQGEPMGVLELDQHGRARDFTTDEQALAQHLGNQIGVAIRLQDQRSVQEQLFRTEKMAAVGRLISTVANELQTPLSSILEMASKAQEMTGDSGPGREVSAIAAEVRKAADIVARLVAFGGGETVEAQPVCVSTLLRELVDFREADWKASGIRVVDLISPEPTFVLGARGQLEQVFLNLLVHAEQSLADAVEKVITIRTVVLSRRLVVEIAFTAPPEPPERAVETASLLGVTRSVIAGHGGEARLASRSGQDPCFEVEFPVAQERVTVAAGPTRDVSRRLTAMVIEPDEGAQRQLLAQLSAQGCRVVPMNNADTALELSQRMRFDLVFCSVHAPGLNWVELSERMQPSISAFALLADRYDAELSADFEGAGRFVLPKPVQAAALERVLYAA
ncbi:MAG TPA: GAF domain-containing protein [Bryobacteraceae bacterium]|nr:GAF domain-containing protein [Bryobacteraceae bacterium]